MAEVMTRPNIIRMGPPDLSRSSNLHGSLLAGYEANGSAGGAVVRLV